MAALINVIDHVGDVVVGRQFKGFLAWMKVAQTCYFRPFIFVSNRQKSIWKTGLRLGGYVPGRRKAMIDP
jgi:orotate phosphoribosyltransferase